MGSSHARSFCNTWPSGDNASLGPPWMHLLSMLLMARLILIFSKRTLGFSLRRLTPWRPRKILLVTTHPPNLDLAYSPPAILVYILCRQLDSLHPKSECRRWFSEIYEPIFLPASSLTHYFQIGCINAQVSKCPCSLNGPSGAGYHCSSPCGRVVSAHQSKEGIFYSWTSRP